MENNWINILEKEPVPGTEVLIQRDYTKYGRGKDVKIAHVHFTEVPRPYGGPMSLTGSGMLTGLYFSVPAVIRKEEVTYWQPVPETI